MAVTVTVIRLYKAIGKYRRVDVKITDLPDVLTWKEAVAPDGEKYIEPDKPVAISNLKVAAYYNALSDPKVTAFVPGVPDTVKDAAEAVAWLQDNGFIDAEVEVMQEKIQPKTPLPDAQQEVMQL